MHKHKSGLLELERKVGPDGKISIPQEFIKRAGIKPRTQVKISLKGHEISIRKDEDFVRWQNDSVKRYGKDISKTNLKKVYESGYDEKYRAGK